MATFGSTNNTNVENVATDHRFTGGVMSEAGTLTDVSVYLTGWAGGATFRFAVYQGGSAGDPTGATLIWQSGQCTDTNGTGGWRTATGSYSQSVSGSLSASRTWIRVKNNDGNLGLTNTDKGDWDSGSEQSNVANSTSVAFASTWESDAGSVAAEAIKAYITYTPAAPSFVPRRTLLGVG